MIQQRYLKRIRLAEEMKAPFGVGAFIPGNILIIRRVLPGVIATDLVGVQPMIDQVSEVSSLNWKYIEEPESEIEPLSEESNRIPEERNVFHGDVGGLSPKKVQEYLAQIKKELEEKRAIRGLIVENHVTIPVRLTVTGPNGDWYAEKA